MAGNQVAYGAKKCETGLSAVPLRPCGPLALIPVNGKKTKSGAKFGPKNDCSARPWGRRVVTFVSESCILVHHTGHSEVFCVIRLSTCENRFFEYDPPKDAQTKSSFHGVSRHFRTFKVPTKLDGGKPS
jgi:hypothetical protein